MRFGFGLFLAVVLWAAPAVAAPPFDGDRAMELLVKQVEFGPRAPGTEAHAEQLAWMREHLGESAHRVIPHAFTLANPYGGEPLHLTNLRASFRPELEERIAFGAHWDCRPRADREPSGPVETPIPGANDGASGVAVLLVVAEVLAKHPVDVGVDLLFLDGEDYGREGDVENYSLGARQFVADHRSYRPKAFILLDMVGDKDLRIPMEAYSLQQARPLTLGVFQRAQELGLASFDPRPGRPVMDDHIPFLQAGIPAVDLIDMEYPPWHTMADTPDQCSAQSLAEVGTLVLSLIYDGFPY